MTPRLVLLQGLALAASLLHVFIDIWIGLYGGGAAGASMSLGQALTLITIAALYGWWLAPLAVSTWGGRGWFLALVILAAVWAALLNGVVGLVACFIPCAAAAPYQDLAHIGSLVLGLGAAWYAWTWFRRTSGPVQTSPIVSAVFLIGAAVVLQAANVTLPR